MNNRVSIPFQKSSADQYQGILISSFVFHCVLIASFFLWHAFRPKPEVRIIPIFDLITVVQPPKITEEISQPEPIKPRPRPVIPEPVKPQEPKPIVREELPPEPKIEDKIKPIEKPEPPVDDFDLPEFQSAAPPPPPAIMLDPLLQVYWRQIIQVMTQNFQPPPGIDLPKGASVTVHFSIHRNGKITGIVLKSGSGSDILDNLAMRAVQISKLPPLPPSYRSPVLPIVYKFIYQG
jgi:TonB family protein